MNWKENKAVRIAYRMNGEGNGIGCIMQHIQIADYDSSIHTHRTFNIPRIQYSNGFHRIAKLCMK